MQVFVYEFVTGGGTFHMQGPDGPCGTLLCEGFSMLRAICEDFAAMPDVQITSMWDERLPQPSLTKVSFQPVESAAAERRMFRQITKDSDYTLVIAPEFKGFLLERAQGVEQAGGRLLGPDAEFIRIAADKTLTCRRLAQAGVRVPRTVLLEHDRSLEAHTPTWVGRSVVVKPNDGAGSTDVRLVHDVVLADVAKQIRGNACVQQFCPGRSASVAVVSGGGGHVVLPPFFQHIEPPAFRYTGGSRIVEPRSSERVTALAEQVCRALPQTRGYYGIDVVLGTSALGEDDYVIEVNPRMTTSYVALRRLSRQNLATAMCEVAAGEHPRLSFRPDSIEFLASGEMIENRRSGEGSSV